MAFYCYSHAAMEADLSKSTFKVYHTLARHVNNKTRDCHLSKALIEKIIGKSESTVNRAFRELIQKGLLKREYRYNKKGGQISNRYTLLDKPEIAIDTASQTFSMSKSHAYRHAISTEIIDENISGIAMKVYCYIKNHANRDGQSFLCIGTIAKDLEVCWRTVHRAIKELVQTGVIVFKSSFGKISAFIILHHNKQSTAKVTAKDYIVAAQNHKFLSKIMRSLGKIFFMRI